MQRHWLSLLSAGFRPDVLWVGHPLLWPLLPASLSARIPVVYDCMDDVVALTPPGVSGDTVQQHEAALVAAAQVILCSSECLRGRLAERYGAEVYARTVLLRNGGQGGPDRTGTRPASDTVESHPPAQGSLQVGYIGTVGHWFDWASVEASLQALPGLQVHIIGPVEAAHPALDHPRVVAHGPVEHSRLPALVAPLHALLMPFQVNRIVEAVDPVKLYEYLSWGRPVFTSHYAEIDRFAPYVHFYGRGDKLCDGLRALSQGTLSPRASDAQVARFLADNSWDHRGDELEAILATLPRL